MTSTQSESTGWGSSCGLATSDDLAIPTRRWDTLYPIYIDRKRPQQDGGRRVNAKIALEWPFAEQMAKACRMLGFEAVFEVRSSASLVSSDTHAQSNAGAAAGVH